MYPKGNNGLRIIALYRGNYKERYYLRQISKLAKLPLKNVQKLLSGLEQEKILKGKVEGKNKYFTLNLDNIKTKSLILQAEIYSTDMFLEKYPLFKTFLKTINSNIPIIVFGSFSKLKADKNSDVDLLVISESKTGLSFHILPYKIHQLNLSEDSFIKALKEKETVIKEIEENHIILNNHSFYVNVLWEHYGK